MLNTKPSRIFNILLVEDSPSDVELIARLFDSTDMSYCLKVVGDGIEAIAYLNRQKDLPNNSRPDLMLLDLNLPKKDGKQVLAEIKSDSSLSQIPIIILATSGDQQDILWCYQMDANCYLTKPKNVEDFSRLIKKFKDFWFNIAILPTQ